MVSQATWFAEFIRSMQAPVLLGFDVVELGDGQSRIELPVRRELTVDGERVQGGLVTVLADYAASAAAGSTLEDGWLVATVGCETHQIAPAAGQRLVALGQVIKRGRRMLAKADVYADAPDGADRKSVV